MGLNELKKQKLVQIHGTKRGIQSYILTCSRLTFASCGQRGEGRRDLNFLIGPKSVCFSVHPTCAPVNGTSDVVPGGTLQRS